MTATKRAPTDMRYAFDMIVPHDEAEDPDNSKTIALRRQSRGLIESVFVSHEMGNLQGVLYYSTG